MPHQRIRFSIALLSLAFIAGACGGGGGVGGGLKDVKGGNKNGAIGQATTTVAPVTTAAPVATTVKKPVATTAPPAAATPEAVYIIQSDTKGQYIEPLSHAVRAGALVRFTNQDNIPHVIEGRINDKIVLGPSPSIAPGANWDVRPAAAGTYDIVDEQRTYAQGVTLTVSH